MAMPPPPPPPMSQSRLEEGFRPGGPPPDEPVPTFIMCMDVINTVTHIVLGAVAFFALTLVNLIPGMPKLTAHVYLTIIGYTLLMSQALFSLKPQSGFANNLKYPQKTKLSWLVQLLGSILVIVGCIMAIVFIEQSSRPVVIPGFPIIINIDFEHFNSGHEIVGFIAMILATVSMVGAFAHLFVQNLENNTMLKAIQSCVLTVTLALASIAICLKLNILRLDDTSSKTGMTFSILAIVGVFFMMVCNLTKGGRFLI